MQLILYHLLLVLFQSPSYCKFTHLQSKSCVSLVGCKELELFIQQARSLFPMQSVKSCPPVPFLERSTSNEINGFNVGFNAYFLHTWSWPKK